MTRFGLALARSLEDGSVGVHDAWCGPEQPEPVAAAVPLRHAQFSDSLWGSTADRAAAALRSVAVGSHTIVVTLHDLPAPRDASDRWMRRAIAYRDVADVADHVVVGSSHELRRLGWTGSTTPATIIPHPAGVGPTPTPAGVEHWRLFLRRTPRSIVVGLLGWVFPDKRYAEVLGSLGGRDDVVVAILGEVAEGHRDHLADLRRQAESSGVSLVVTGWLTDPDRAAAMRAVDVAVVGHPAPSTSGSVLTWIGAGVRPLVRRSAATTELLRRAPGCVVDYEPSSLPMALARAVAASPAPSRPVPDELSTARAARRHVRLYRRLGVGGGT